jgi:5-formyltetrahydrofolate cyclo-ligase
MSNLNSQTLSYTPHQRHTDIQEDKKKLRSTLRKQRRSLSYLEQEAASKNLIIQINQSKLLLKHQHIALYLGNDGELNPEILINKLWKQKKHVYLPVLHPFYKNTLCFCRMKPESKLIKNRFGILEPYFKYSKSIQKRFLSLVLMPLVAFDKTGNRIGMGGGFYDRSFSYKANSKHCKPKLIGVAHAFQEQNSLPLEKWDIPLEGVLTDKTFYQFGGITDD